MRELRPLVEVFISYARANEETAVRVAEGLRQLGHEVWRDDQLPAHRAYTEVIEERLRAAKAVVVLWSKEARASEWVRAEADLARTAGTLVQVVLDSVTLPLPFNQIQCADLKDWTGDASTAGWRKMADSVAALVGRPGPTTASPAPSPAADAKPSRTTIAVLAFDNYSNDPEMDYFSDGLSEEILQTVARTTDLSVIARASSFQFRGAAKAARAVGVELGATHLLDGSVRRSGQRVRITAQLVICADETSVWSDRFDRDLSDVFALQDEIAEAVAGALKAAFAPSPVVRKVDPAAYDLYLRGRSLSVGQATPAGTALFEQAVAIDPEFATGWAALCHARATQAHFGPWTKPQAELKAEALLAADKALALNPECGSAYASLSRLEPLADYARREDLFRKALDLAPDDPETLTALGAFCNHVGFIDEAYGYLKRAWELDPLYPEAANIYGAILAASGRYDEGRAHYEACRARWPEHSIFITGEMNYDVLTGAWDHFEQLAALARAGGAEDPALKATLRLGEALKSGDSAIRQRLVERMHAQMAQTGAAPLHSLVTLSAIGMTDEAYDAIAQSDFSFMFAEDGPQPAGAYNPGIIFDPTYSRALMEDVRFVGLCHKLGLATYWLAADRWPDCAGRLEGVYDFAGKVRSYGDSRNNPPPVTG